MIEEHAGKVRKSLFYWLFGNKKIVYVLVIRDLLCLKSLFFLIRKQIRSIFDLLANFDFRLTDPKIDEGGIHLVTSSSIGW